ncbi:hypothetical protein QL285_057178 [Trifolium repens]|nr:hypothetical protein QL285_057178 [Trifolium repens]
MNTLVALEKVRFRVRFWILDLGTSFSRSQLQLVTPLLEALPGLLSPALLNILSLTPAWFVESSSRAVEVFYLKFNRSLEASITISTGTDSISK